MNPYNAFIIGDQIFKGPVYKEGGKHPHWEGIAVTAPYNNDSKSLLRLLIRINFVLITIWLVFH
jgi:hypothetical protein